MTRKTSNLRLLVQIGLLAGFAILVYVAAGALVYQPGFPLDDAWIHQAYARNLGLRGEWSFLAGQPSAGATSPLWAALIAPAYLLGVEPLVWTYLLGWSTLALLALVGVRLFEVLVPESANWKIWVAAGLTFEWHLVWAAASGMETLVAGLFYTLVMVVMLQDRVPWIWLGLLIGATAWVRPDGITLLGPATLVLFANGVRWGKRLRTAAWFFAGFGVIFVPYLFFNDFLAGTVWPNTFYAKQAEYQVLQTSPLLQRYLAQLALPLIGAGVLLLPGAVYFVWHSWTARDWPRLTGVLWWLGYLGLYAWRLPVTYQHGRYLMPAMPIFFIWGAAGLVLLIRQVGDSGRLVWALGRAWVIAAALTLMGFWALGARAYAFDVAFIESEMVAVAEWVRTETSPDSVLGVHDIGAIGYFSERNLVDLAGLVSPAVIPFIRDENRLAAYLDDQAVDYLITFPGWYPDLVRRGQMVYQTSGAFGPQLGGENMAVYEWR